MNSSPQETRSPLSAEPDASSPQIDPSLGGWGRWSDTRPQHPNSHVADSGPVFWTRHKTVINFWLDAALLVLFLVFAWELAILRLTFPKGAGDRWRLLDHTAADWQDLAFNTFCVFSLGIVVHVMLHWSWIVGTIQTRLLKRKATRDDGSHTMIGVGVLFVLIHLLAGGVLWARWAIVEVR